MKSFRLLSILAAVLVVSHVALANVADVAKAARILSKIIEITSKYQQYSTEVKAPAPLPNNSGLYEAPYLANGAMTEWATKTLNVQLGAMAGEKAGDVAGKAFASKVPFGGLMSGTIKKKGKEMGAVAAIGGAEFIKKASDQSFNNLDDYSVYLHVTHSKDGDYQQALAAAMAIYPSLENTYEVAVKKAYEQAARDAKAAEKAAAKAAKDAAKAAK